MTGSSTHQQEGEMLHIRKRTLTTGLVVLAASLPAAAQARPNIDPEPGPAPQPTAIAVAPPALPARSANAGTSAEARPRTRRKPAGLTPREVEVLTHLAQGMRNAQIAQRLVVSEKTIDHHVSAVLRKLGASTRGEASAEAQRLGLTSPMP
jgi:DNA-binding NarL/FixJ family response regulator